jgi:predicted outer membrane protein
MKRMAILAVAAVTTFGIGCNTDRRANTADNPAVGTSGRADVSRADRDFVNDLTITNMAEIELGRMAAERAANAEVKRFGQMMVDDHTAAGNKLKPIATEHSIPMPADLDDKHRDLRERLSKLQGAAFDREYMKAMVDGHEDVIAKLESRIDKERLAEYKAKYENRDTGRKTSEDIKVDVLVPESSDDRVTISVNQWAANSYPVTYGHLQKAKALNEVVRKAMTN